MQNQQFIQSAATDAAQINANLSTSGTDTQLNADLNVFSNHHSDEQMIDQTHPTSYLKHPNDINGDLVSTGKHIQNGDPSISIEAKNLSLQIHTCIETKEEPIELLNQLNNLLFHQYPFIIQELMSGSLQDRLDFYKTVFKITSEKLLQTQNLVQTNYLPQILKFFRNILVNFFPEDIEQEMLADVVHSLFNLDAPLYTLALQNSYIKKLNQAVEVDYLNTDDEDLTLDQRRIKREYEWRLQLQPGSRLDAVIQVHIQNHRVSQWCKGTVLQVTENNQILITFDNASQKLNRVLNRFGNDIAMLDTYTDDIDWKYELKQNDLIDCMDPEHVWYRSTVLDTRTILDDQAPIDNGLPPKEIKQIYVGYRIYDEEEGHKWDDDGRKFLGWSNRYDIWTSVTDPIIQRHKSMIKQYQMVGKNFQIYDIVVDDVQDIIQNTKERKVWTVFRNNFFSNLRCIPDYFNEFGLKGGFEKILHFLRNKGATKTLRQLYLLIDFLSKSQPLWHRQFACYFIPELKQAVEQALLYTNKENTGPIQLKFTKESLSGLQRAFQSILRRHYTQDKYHQIMAELNFSVGFSLLKSDKLEHRIQGIKEVIEQIKGTKFSLRKTLSAKEVMAKLKEENIFETIFGDNYHIQLIQRSLEIIKFYINEKQITEKEIDQIWQATKKDQQTKMEIYKIILDCAIMFKNDEIEMLVQRFSQVPPDQFVEKEIECVYEMSKYSNKNASYSVRAAQLFWDIAVQERAYKKQIIEMAMDKFIDLIRNWDREQKYNFINKCIQKIRNNESSVQCIKIIQKILEQIPNYKVNNQITLYDVANNLIKEDDLVNLVIFDLILYNDQINELWNKKILTEQNIEYNEVLDLPFNHRSQSYIRLNFIRQMLQNSHQQLDQAQLDQVWDLLMVRSKVSIDSDIFFDWFKQLLSDQNKLSPDLILHFFQSKVCSQNVNFKFIKKSGFDCIKNIFLKINEQEDKIQIILNPGMGNNNLSQKLEIKVHEAPNNLIGIDVIWKLLGECDKKNADLTALVIELITKVYHSLSPNLEAQKQAIEDQFCREAIGRIHNVVDNPDLSDDDKRNFVKSSTIMLKSFFQDSEKNGTGDMKPHAALQKGLYVENLIIQNTITNNKSCPKYIVLNVYSNITIWQLKKLIASKLMQSPLRIQLNRFDSKKKQISDLENMTILKEFRFDAYEMINAQKKPNLCLPRVNLLTKKKELVPEARAIFESWFDKFSDEDGFMTPDLCVDFIKNSTQDQTVAITDPRIVRLFNEYDKDIDGKLTKDEFIEFYKDRSIQKPDLVWNNLDQHGYGSDFKPKVNQQNVDDPNEVKDPSILPRFKLSQDQEIFNDLFKLFDKLGNLGQDDLWQFIQQLRTNPLIYSKILSLSGLSEIIEETSMHKILYQLQILESLINEYQELKPQEIKCYYYENQDYNANFPSLDNQNTNLIDQSNRQYQSDNINESQRDKQNIAPESGVIPLPQGPAMINQTGNIPDAPPLYGPGMPFIGPLPAVGGNQNVLQNNQRNKDTLENFKGQIITESYCDYIISNEEIASYLGTESVEQVNDMRQNFILYFVSNDGFKVLQQILLKIVGVAQLKQEKEVFNNRSQRECLNTIIKFIKVFLMSSFMGNSQSAELTLEMTRKLSQKHEDSHVNYSDNADLEKLIFNDTTNQNTQVPFVNQNQGSNTSDSKKVEVKKSQIQTEQEDLEQQYRPLINLLQGDLGQRIIDSIDFKEFQNQILSLILIILKKKEKLVADDLSNVQTSFYLWISVIIYNSDMLQSIFEDYSQAENQGTQSIIERIIDQGLLSSNYTIRSGMFEGFKFLFLNIKMQALSESPYLFLLRVILKNISLTENKFKESKQYYNLLKVLLEKYFQSKHSSAFDFKPIFDTKEILHEFIVRLQTYDSNEFKNKFFEDTNLCGIIQTIDEIIRNEPNELNIDEYRNLLQYLIEKCLFCFDLSSLEGHIGKDTKLQEHEKPQINKCLTTESRFIGFTLLKRICETQIQLIPEMIQSYFYPLVKKVQRPKRPNYAPRQEGRSFHGFCGIRNLGCICYMNSMIQQFFHIPAFRYCLMATQDNQPLCLTQFEGREVDDNMLHQLMRMMGFLELSERQDYDPRDFCFSFKDYAGQPTNVRIQQDTQEFLNLAFDRIERLLEGTSQKYLLNNIFQGSTCSLMICKNCGNLRQNKDNFYNLSLEVKNQKTIHDALKKFIVGEIINDFKCEACNQKVDVERRTVIDKLPNMLMVHLQRIIFDFDTFQNVKLNSRLEFPNVLNLKPYMLSEIMKQEKDILAKAQKEAKKLQKQQQREALQKEQEAQQKMKQEEGKIEDQIDMEQIDIKSSPSTIQQNADDVMSSDDENEEMQENIGDYMELADEDYEYKLVGVVVHMGTATAGHYISYINIKRGHKSEEDPEWLCTEKDKWLEFNDSTVKDFRFSNLEEDCFGGIAQGVGIQDMKSDYTKNAYMLIYEKRRKEPMKIVLPENLLNQSQFQQTLGCDGTAISRDQPAQLNDENDLHFLHVLPQLQEIVQKQGILYDDNKHENYALVEFNSAQKFVPKEIYKQVHEDNVSFLREKQVINHVFFETMKTLLDVSMEKLPEIYQEQSPLNEMLFEFIQRMIFEFLPYTTENKCAKDLNNIMLKSLNLNTSQLVNFIDQRILVDKSKLDKDERTFIENLIQKMDTDTREANKNILIYVVNKLFELERYDKIDEIMQPILGMIPEDFSKNWLKIGQVLEFLFEVTKSGYAQMSYMIKNNIITKLIDLLMENESPKAVGKNRQTMGSNYAQPQLNNAILIISLICRNYPRIKMITESEQTLQHLEGYNYISPMFMGYYKEELPPLSDEDLFILSQKNFYVKNLKSGYERVEFGRLITHLQFTNFNFSRQICKKILVGLNKATSDEVDPYLHAINPLFQMHDPYKFQRFEWILGMPQLKIDRTTIYNNNQSTTCRKVGVSAIDAANDDVFEYKSTLFKQESTVKESFLQILYQFRKRWPKYLYQSLMCLLQTCQQDQSGQLLHYIKTLEPPNYVFGRYIDWIPPYIQDQIDMNTRSQSQSAKSELLLAIQVQTMLDVLFKSSEQNNQQQQVQQQNNQDANTTTINSEVTQIDTSTSPAKQDFQPQMKQKEEKYKVYNYSSQDGGPDQYLIWNVVEENVKEDRTIEDQNVQFTVRELTCRITESKPDGRYNKIFVPNQFSYQNRQKNKNNYNDINDYAYQNNSNSKNRHLNYGRGQRNDQDPYQVEKKSDQFSIMTANRSQYGRGSSKKQKQNRGRTIHYDNDQVYSANNQDIEARGQQSQDDSMEVEYNEDNQDQLEYFSEDNGNNNSNKKENQRYNVGSNTPQDDYIDNVFPQGQGNNIDPQDANILNDLDKDQQDDKYPSNGYGTVPGPVVTSLREPRKDRKRDYDEEEAMEQDNESNAAAAAVGYHHNYVKVSNQDIDQEPVNQPQNVNQIEVEDLNEQENAYGDPNTWEAAQQCVLVFTVKNLDNMNSKNVIICFRDMTQPGEPPINFRLPKTIVPAYVMGGKERDILVLTKLRPFDTWGNYEYQISVQEPKQREMQQKTNLNLAKVGVANDQTQYGGSAGGTSYGGPYVDANIGANIGVGIDAGVGGDMYSDLMDAEMSNQKACSICTFLNSSYLTICEMCGSNL